MGSRIIPMSQDTLSRFRNGIDESAAAQRTILRNARRIRERQLLRRERLHRVLHVLGFLPLHYDCSIGWDKKNNQTYGKFLPGTEPKLSYKQISGGKSQFIFEKSYREMLDDIERRNPGIAASLSNRKISIPPDWTLYYLRNKALTQPVTKDELSWIILSFNRKRGYNPRREDSLSETNFPELTDSTPGSRIYERLITNPFGNIPGDKELKFSRTQYHNEADRILERQSAYHPELKDPAMHRRCIAELYPNNLAHADNLARYDLKHLILNDILFYQRPLKSKKSLIGNCPYETYTYYQNGKQVSRPVKCIPRSHPLYQEFRIWQFTSNLRIYKYVTDLSGKTEEDVTEHFFPDSGSYSRLYTWLNDRKSVNMKSLMREFLKIRIKRGDNVSSYRWNLLPDQDYPCNETRFALLSGLARIGVDSDFLSPVHEKELWQLLYSITDRNELFNALERYAVKYSLPTSFADEFSIYKPYDRKYGNYSEKALKKILPLMRQGDYWSPDFIHPQTRDRIEKILAGESGGKISDRVYQHTTALKTINDYQGLPLWLSCYIVYNRYSEPETYIKWKQPEEIDSYLKNNFPSISLRNPVVKKVVMEALRTTADIWKRYGEFAKIHIELARQIRLSAKQRARPVVQSREHTQTNIRLNGNNVIKANYTTGFHKRQLTDTQYISKMVAGLLSNIVREPGEMEAVSQNVLVTTGAMSYTLKKEWGLSKVWNDILQSRFDRLSKQHDTGKPGSLPDRPSPAPTDIFITFSKKRIDHRHHALDALIIACTTRGHIRQLTDSSACLERIHIPWPTFTTDVKQALELTIITYKKNTRILTRTTNLYQKYVEGRKTVTRQERGDRWAVRKPLHTSMPYGRKTYEWLQKSDGSEKPSAVTRFRRRQPITILGPDSERQLNIRKIIRKIPDPVLQRELIGHLEAYNDNSERAFSAAGIAVFNKKRHTAVKRLPVAETGTKRFRLGITSGTRHKWMEAAEGTNLFFAVYENPTKKRSYDSVPLHTVIDRLKKGNSPVPEHMKKGREEYKLLFWLSPNDLVYVPTLRETDNPQFVDFRRLSREQVKRIYRFVSCTGTEAYFVPHTYASPIIKNEIGTNNKSERMVDLVNDSIVLQEDTASLLPQIKSGCWKLEVSRLGEIIGYQR